MKLRCIYSLRKKKWWKETNMALTFLLTHIDSSLTVYTSFLRFKVVFHVQFILLHEPEPNCLLANCQAPLHRRDWQKEKSPKSSSLKILHEQAVHWFPVPLGQILELPAKTCTEFSNECRWTGGERLYSIRSAVNTLAYRKYLYVNLQWLSLMYLNTVKSFPIFMLL